MRPEDAERIFDKWKAWLREIEDDVIHTKWRARIYAGLAEIVDSNPAIRKPSAFYTFLRMLYADSISMAIRRQVKCRDDSISLARLLKDISKKPAVVTLERVVGDITQNEIRRDFERHVEHLFTDDEPRHIRPELVVHDLQRLKNLAAPIEKHADERVAHRDKNPSDTLPTYGDIDECIDYMKKAVLTYRALLERIIATELDDRPVGPWKEIFKEPWIRSEP